MKQASDPTPPNWIRKFLTMFLEPRMLEACLGDLEEKFSVNVRNHVPQWKAKALYIIEALGFLKMAGNRKRATQQSTINLISHTILFLTRLVQRDKSYYLVSLIGLTLSLSSFLFITMFIRDELSFDQFHDKKENIYRLTTHLRLSDVEYNLATSQFPAAEAIKSELAEVEHAVRVFPQDVNFTVNDKKFEEHVFLVDENFFDVFSFPFIEGTEKGSLANPAGVILARATALKYFGHENPLGKHIILNEQTLTVTGVVENVPEQSHIHFDAIIPLRLQLNIWKSESGLEGRENKWFWIGTYTYVLLKNQVDAAMVNDKLPVIINKYFPDRYKENGKFRLQRVTDIHLKSTVAQEIEPGGSILHVRLFSIVAIVIMIVSAINLINLSWFKISGRIREVGIRKFLGQNSARIVAQLSLESTMIGILAFFLAVILCVIFLSEFNILVQKNLNIWSVPNVQILCAAMALITTICVLAVIRPAIHFVTRSSVLLLLQKYTSHRTVRMRNVLVGLQVCFSFVLLVFSMIITSQIDYFKNKDLGFDKKNIIVVELNEDIYPHTEAFRNELKKSRHVVEVAGGAAPGNEYNGWRFVPEEGSYEKPYLFPLAWCDYNFISTLDIKLLAGKNFEPDNKTYDSIWPFIINKTAAIELGWLDDPINKTLEVFAPGTTAIMAKGKVIGVIEDYHYESLRNPVKPVVLTVTRDYGTAMIRISGDSYEHAVRDIGVAWKKFSDKPFIYEDMEKKMDRLYSSEVKFSNIMLFFTGIALVLTCYGMFAMSSLLFSSRLKEVSIRKVFGADHFAIIKQFYSRYAAFNLAAIMVGIPIALYTGNLWLETFKYRIELTSSLFIIAGACILLAGLLSVSYYLIRVAFSNPIRFLRRE